MKPTRHRRFFTLTLGALTLALGTSAAAAPKAELKPAPGALQALLVCRAEPDDHRRLACFDAAAGQLQTAASSGDVVVVDRSQIRTLRRQAFGFTLPSLSMLTGMAHGDDGADSIELGFTGTQTGGDGHTLYSFDDGSVWRQMDQAEFGRSPKPREKAEIRRASLGGFLLSIGKRPGVKVQRQH